MIINYNKSVSSRGYSKLASDPTSPINDVPSTGRNSSTPLTTKQAQRRYGLALVGSFILVILGNMVLIICSVPAVETDHSTAFSAASAPTEILPPPTIEVLKIADTKMLELDLGPIAIVDITDFSLTGEPISNWQRKEQDVSEELLLWVKPSLKSPLVEPTQSAMASTPSFTLSNSTTFTQPLLFPWSITQHDPKHFQEAGHMRHLDHRFAVLPSPTTRPDPKFADKKMQDLIHLLSAYSKFTSTHNITSWIAHGTLLSWYWGQNLFPWDDDMDFQVPLQQLLNIMLPHNNTLFEERYLLDINPNVLYRGYQRSNVIDARFIDTTNGRYLDVTALAYSPSLSVVSCKSPHRMRVSDVNKLHRTRIAGVEVWRPEGAAVMLGREYYERGLTSTQHMGYVFKDGRWDRPSSPPKRRPKNGALYLDD